MRKIYSVLFLLFSFDMFSIELVVHLDIKTKKTGTIVAYLCNNHEDFCKGDLVAVKKIPLSEQQSHLSKESGYQGSLDVTFEVEQGEYNMLVFVDLNEDGVPNSVGLEPWGVSGKRPTITIPKWNDTKFAVSQENHEVRFIVKDTI